MNTTHILTARILAALALILLLAPAASFAHEPHGAKVLVKIAEGDDLVELDLTGLQVGESKQLFSESGKQIVVTREEDGYQVDVDGKELHVMPFGDDVMLGEGKHKVFISEDGEVVKLRDDGHQVWISADGEEHSIHKIGIGGGEDQQVWVSADGEESAAGIRKIMVRRLGEGEEAVDVKVVGVGAGEPQVLTLERESAADRLAKSGLLDNVDEETRQKILDFLKSEEPKVLRVKTVVVGGDKEE